LTGSFFLVASLLCSSCAYALDPQVTFRNYRLDRWSVEDGLPQQSVLAITQDRDGYLWAATQNGIARFDGNHFDNFDRASTQVDTTVASCAYTDTKGVVWFCTPRGAIKIVDEKLSAVAFTTQTLEIFDINQSNDGTVLFASSQGILREGKAGLETYLLEGKAATSFFRDKANLWIAGENQIWRMHAGKIEPVASFGNQKIKQIIKRHDEFWLATSAGVIKYSPATGLLEQAIAELNDLPIERMYLDSSGNMWVSTTKSLHRVRPNNQIENIKDSDFIPQAWVRSFYEDRDGDLWLGSYRESLLRLRNSAARWISTPEGLPDPLVWTLARASNGELLIGSNTGLFALEGGSLLKKLFAPPENKPRSIYDLTVDGKDIWVGTRAGIARVEDGKLLTPEPLRKLDNAQINGIYPVGDHDVWIATMQGLYRYHSDVLTQHGPGAGEPAGRVRHLLITDAEHFLFSTEDGIFQYARGVISRPVWSEGLRGNFVPRMKWIKPDVLAFTTMDSGLGLVRKNKLIMLGMEDGLPTRNGWTLDVIDGQLYVATIIGVYRIALDNLPDPLGGVKNNLRVQTVVESGAKASGPQRFGCCNGGASARSLVEGKLLWLTSTTGLVRLDTAKLPALPAAPKSRIEALMAGDVAYSFDDENISIPSDKRDLSIHYTGMTFRRSKELEFRYRLEGYDGDWHEAGTRRVAFYTQVPPGKYQFVVQARYPGGEYGAESKSPKFNLDARWYEQRSLQLLALLGVIGFSALLLWRRISALARQKRALEHAVAMRTLELEHSNELLSKANRALHYENRTDPLTGLLNRRALVVPQNCAMILVDVDFFKRINDQHGHEAGDRALSAIADILSASIRSQDSALRWGGEEFLLILDGIGLDDAITRAEAIRRQMNTHLLALPNDERLSFTCSFGVSIHPVLEQHRENWQASLQLADAALYRAKAQGRNLVYAAKLAPDMSNQALDFGSQDVLSTLESNGRLIWIKPDS
jgi:diguanylate cyclase (GGDEF)-like protein